MWNVNAKCVLPAKAVDLGIIDPFVGEDNDGDSKAKTARTPRLVQGRCQEFAELCKRPAFRNSGGKETSTHAGRRCSESDGTRDPVPIHQPQAPKGGLI